ncbi:MAG: M23 family metallopeptidase [Alphaproteobacteria bacterium]|nr:M23 family metallopeptidase [Alphaproteobacteria bacterium]
MTPTVSKSRRSRLCLAPCLALGLAAGVAGSPAGAADTLPPSGQPAAGPEAEASFFLLKGKPVQGGLMRGAAPVGATVTLDGFAIPTTQDGNFVFGFDRDFAGSATLDVTLADGRTQSRVLAVEPRDYDIQRIDGLPPAMVTPPDAETLARIQRESAIKAAARPKDSPLTAFTESFVWPVLGPITGTYGSQRILNGEPRRPHYGVDIAAPRGTPVKAPAGGVVTLAEPDMYYEGGLIFVDHGHGLIGVFMHLDEVTVAVGDRITQGDVIGKVGSAGRSTGAHLDWRMYWRAAHIDPTLLVPPMEDVLAAADSAAPDAPDAPIAQ